jgi:MFS family permease
MTATAALGSKHVGSGLRRNRNWRLLWTGQIVSVVGDYVFDVTVLLWVARFIALGSTWAPAAASGVLVAAGVPMLLVGPFAGVFVDRWDHRRTMLLADAARAVLIAALIPLSLPAIGAHTPRMAQLALVYTVVAAAACFSRFFSPARYAMLPILMPAADVPRATSRLVSTSYAAAVVAPPLAAPLLFAAGASWALIIDAISFAASFAMIRLVRPGRAAADGGDAAPGPAGVQPRYWREFGSGLRFFASSQILVAAVAGLSVTALGAAAINALNVFFFVTRLHASASLYGTVSMAEGAGGVVGTLAAVWVMSRARAGRIFCGGLVLAGTVIVAYSRARDLPAALVLLAVIGGVLGVVNSVVSPLVLSVTPQQLVGRVMSVIGPAAYIASVCATAAAGVVASTVLRGFRASLLGTTFGPYDTIIAAGGLLFVIAGVVAWPALRHQ